jgi:YHS domain-containing protein
MAKDPVCGMDVDPKTAAGQSQYQGQTYYFCSTGCKREFDQDPQKYAGKQQGQHSGHQM